MRVDVSSGALAAVRDHSDFTTEYPDIWRRIRMNYRATISYMNGVTIHVSASPDDLECLRAYMVLMLNKRSRRREDRATDLQVAVQRITEALIADEATDRA